MARALDSFDPHTLSMLLKTADTDARELAEIVMGVVKEQSSLLSWETTQLLMISASLMSSCNIELDSALKSNLRRIQHAVYPQFWSKEWMSRNSQPRS